MKKLFEQSKKYFRFFPDLLVYFFYRGRQIRIWSFLLVEFLISVGSNIKKEVIKRMFWGRNSFYRTIFHFTILTITFLTFVNGVSSRIMFLDGEESRGLTIADGQIGYNDMILQQANAKVFTVKEASDLPFDVINHEVQEGESLDLIAKKYNINDVTSIQWANGLDPYASKLKVGQKLKIPPMTGVLKEAKKGDTAETIMSGVKNAYLYDVLELNNLDEGEVIAEGTLIFIPNGDIPLPPPSSIVKGGGNKPTYVDIANSGIDVPPGTFVNPMGDPSCSGYGSSRGYFARHTGVDLTKKGGCWIRSIGSGTVAKAAWCPGGLGHCVVIKHANGISSVYAHGDGTFAVKEGQTVQAGQKIMYMGNSGNSRGTHLHLSVAGNDNDVVNCYSCRINPSGIVPY